MICVTRPRHRLRWVQVENQRESDHSPPKCRCLAAAAAAAPPIFSSFSTVGSSPRTASQAPSIHPSKLALARNTRSAWWMRAQMPAAMRCDARPGQMQHPAWRQSSEIRPRWWLHPGVSPPRPGVLCRIAGPPNAFPRRKLPCIQPRTNRARHGFNRSQRSGLRRRSVQGGRRVGGGLRAPSCHPRSSARGAVG